MENAVEALKMAFAVILLVLALGLSMTIFSKARETSQLMLKYSEPTEYYEYYDYSKDNEEDALGNRIVGIETIIPTLYKYSKERYKVTFKEGTIDTGNTFVNSNGETVQLVNVNITNNLEIYETTTNPDIEWSKSYKNDFDNTGTSKKICSFDIDEEIKRGECWTADVKNHLDKIISGGWYIKPQYNTIPLDEFEGYSDTMKRLYAIEYKENKALLQRFKNARFVELVGEIPNKTTNEAEGEDTENEGIVGNKTTTKKIITYVLINN